MLQAFFAVRTECIIFALFHLIMQFLICQIKIQVKVESSPER